MLKPFYKSSNHDFNLLHGDTFELLPQFNFKFDMIFADPPYFLSSGGISVQSGKVVCVDKGDWDKSMSQDDINAFNLKCVLRQFLVVLKHLPELIAVVGVQLSLRHIDGSSVGIEGVFDDGWIALG